MDVNWIIGTILLSVFGCAILIWLLVWFVWAVCICVNRSNNTLCGCCKWKKNPELDVEIPAVTN